VTRDTSHTIYDASFPTIPSSHATRSGLDVTVTFSGSRGEILSSCGAVPLIAVMCSGTTTVPAPLVTYDAGPPVDASSVDSGGTDSGTVTKIDAGASCIATASVDPPNGTGTTSLSPTAFGCPNGTPTASVFELTKQMNFAMWFNHTLSADGATQIQLHAGCELSSPLLTSANYDRRTHGALLDPGTYTFVTCDAKGSFMNSPTPATPNTNTSCAAAVALPNTGERSWDPAEVRYYTFNQVATGARAIEVESVGPGIPMITGFFRLRVRTTCDDDTTTFYDSNNDMYPPTGYPNPRRYSIGSPAVGTYWVVLSDVDPGLDLTLRFTTYP